MRISSALAATLLAGCGPAEPEPTQIAQVEPTPAAGDDRLFCARGDAPLAQTCTVEQARGPEGVVLTIRHEDGGFRRLRITGDGRGVIAADGAEVATVAVIDADRIDVTIGTDRYRLPATVNVAR